MQYIVEHRHNMAAAGAHIVPLKITVSRGSLNFHTGTFLAASPYMPLRTGHNQSFLQMPQVQMPFFNYNACLAATDVGSATLEPVAPGGSVSDGASAHTSALSAASSARTSVTSNAPSCTWHALMLYLDNYTSAGYRGPKPLPSSCGHGPDDMAA